LELLRSFNSLLKSDVTDNPVTVHENLIEMGGFPSTPGRFTIDKNLGKNSQFGIYVENAEDHLVK
jgi:hypothetical protein